MAIDCPGTLRANLDFDVCLKVSTSCAMRNAHFAACVERVNSPLQRVEGRGFDCLINGNPEIKVGVGLRVVDLFLHLSRKAKFNAFRSGLLLGQSRLWGGVGE